jgi:uncharacterized damage-inducible protein DinB
MSEVLLIQDQMKRAFEGGAWHGPALMEVLASVDAARASARPITTAHSIWEITLHIAAWKDIARARIEGERGDVPDDVDWPPVRESGESSWRAARETLLRAHESLFATAARLDDARLYARMAGLEYSPYFLLHGVIQHDLYHAGQIALLKKG